MSTANPDSTPDEAELLEEQLRAALVDAQSARSPAFEVALLAGLRQRMAGQPDILRLADDWFDGDGAAQIAQEIPAIGIAPRVDALLSQLDEHDEEERTDALLAFDELCAGFTYCGFGSRCDGAARVIARAIRAMPQVWSPLSDFASRVLQHAPPLTDDPAGLVWRAIEAAQALSEAPNQSPVEAIPMLRFIREPARLAASSGKIQSKTALLGSVAEVALVESPEGVELLIRANSDDAIVSAEHEGQALILHPVHSGFWSCPAEPGLYVFTINGTPYPFEIV